MAGRKKAAAVTVVAATEAEIAALGGQVPGPALAATALALARELDGPNSATSKSMCAKALMDVLRDLRALAPPRETEDEIERARKRRAERLARQSASRSAASS